MKKIYDSDGIEVKEGCEVSFSYGIPPVHVIGQIERRGRKLIVITKGHHPEESDLSKLEENAGCFYVRGKF